MDIVGTDLIKLRNPGMDLKNSKLKVAPIEVVGDFFIYLHIPNNRTLNPIEGSFYAVAHIQRGLVLWQWFTGISHARIFAQFIDESQSLRISFMQARYRPKIREKLVELGYLPLTSK